MPNLSLPLPLACAPSQIRLDRSLAFPGTTQLLLEASRLTVGGSARLAVSGNVTVAGTGNVTVLDGATLSVGPGAIFTIEAPLTALLGSRFSVERGIVRLKQVPPS